MLEKLTGGVSQPTAALFWLEHVDLKYYKTDNVVQRLFGQFRAAATAACRADLPRIPAGCRVVWGEAGRVVPEVSLSSLLRAYRVPAQRLALWASLCN